MNFLAIKDAFRHKRLAETCQALTEAQSDLNARQHGFPSFAELQRLASEEAAANEPEVSKEARAIAERMAKDAVIFEEKNRKALEIIDRRRDCAEQLHVFSERKSQLETTLANQKQRQRDAEAIIVKFLSGERSVGCPLDESELKNAYRHLAELPHDTRLLPLAVQWLDERIAAMRAELRRLK